MPIGLPIKSVGFRADSWLIKGSMRQRSAGSWELRVFVGVDPDTKRRRYRSVTVRGSRADAQRELDIWPSARSMRARDALRVPYQCGQHAPRSTVTDHVHC